jgi:LysM repeat protein
MGSNFGRDHANPLFKEMEGNIVSRPKATTSTRTYQVKKGDTWWSVANAADMTTDELQKLNKMKKYEALKIGQTLTVKGKESISTQKTQSSSTTPTKLSAKKGVKDIIEPKKNEPKKNEATKNKIDAPVANNNQKSEVYTVKKGDTLMKISRANNVSVDDLAKWNHMNKKTANLSLGQKIKLQP